MSWIPLESDPEILTKYLHNIGVPPKWQITDVFGLDEDSLASLPQPVKSFILLFPVSDKYEAFRAEEDAELKAKNIEHPADLFFMKQKISNACGTIAIIHAIANSGIELNDGILKSFLASAKDKTAEERSDLLEEEKAFSQSHEGVANEGLTNPNAPVRHHFIALTAFNGSLYELDGRKSFPINHGATTPETFLKSCADVCQKFMARDPEDVNFNIVALVPM